MKSPKHQLKLPTKTGASIYKADYLKKPLDTDLKMKSIDSYKPNHPFEATTTYNQNFIPHRPESAKPTKTRHVPLEDAPRFLNSHYKGEFIPWQAEPIQKVEPAKNNLFGSGGPFQAKSLYSSDFLGKPLGEKSNIDPKSQSSSIFKGFAVPMKSSYQSQYTKKAVPKENNPVPSYQSSMMPTYPVKYSS